MLVWDHPVSPHPVDVASLAVAEVAHTVVAPVTEEAGDVTPVEHAVEVASPAFAEAAPAVVAPGTGRPLVLSCDHAVHHGPT